MNKLLNQKLLFLISLLCVVTVTVGAVFLPRYLSRGLDKSRLNKVTVSDRSHFSYLEKEQWWDYRKYSGTVFYEKRSKSDAAQ